MSRPQQRGSPGVHALPALGGPEDRPSGCTHVNMCSVSRGLRAEPPRAASAGSPFSLAAVLNTLRHLSTTTSILTDPSQLPEQAAEAVTRINQRAGES